MVREDIGGSSEFVEGQMRNVIANGRPLIVARVESKLYAMDGRCSHMGFDLCKGRLDGHLVSCKLHGAQFDIRTGERVRNLSARNMAAYPVVEENGRVLVELP
jgi:nitrite reductase/ring-hydroxylating ferredoxin subunit